MCGRFTLSVNKEEMQAHLIEYYKIVDYDNNIILPRYNVAPGQTLLTIINHENKNHLALLKWGFIPFFVKDENIGYSMINAKSETLEQKRFFKDSLINKRCVILADGFYEWFKEGNKKVPLRFLMNDKSIFPMAGLWSSYIKEDGTKIFTCTIITTNANSIVSLVHDRMPVILSNDSKDIWLDSNLKDINLLKSILIPFDSSKMNSYKVSSLVNSSKNELPECINSI